MSTELYYMLTVYLSRNISNKYTCYNNVFDLEVKYSTLYRLNNTIACAYTHKIKLALLFKFDHAHEHARTQARTRTQTHTTSKITFRV